MTPRQILSSVEFKTKTIKGDFLGVPGIKAPSNGALVLVNCDGKVLHYEDEKTPYTPVGGTRVFADLIITGQIVAPCFNWR